MRVLYLTHEPWPTFRNDVAMLFGKALPRLGLASDLVTDRGEGATPWDAGEAMLFRAPRSRALWYISKLGHNLRVLIGAPRSRYDAIQVRDMPFSALFALCAARMKGLRFFYWMSFPKSEAQVLRARSRGVAAGLRYWVPLVQGHLGLWLLYRVVLPRADHVFVQSDRMVEDVAAHGVSPSRMTPVPMGVDTASASPDLVRPVDDPRLEGKRVAVYLGTLDPERHIELLLEVLSLARQRQPDLVLVIAGDTKDASYRMSLRATAADLGVSDAVIWTGWLPIQEAWRYVRAAEVGLSPMPRGPLLDSSSPTKAVEYLALGVPVVANDNPDQERMIRESGAGICVDLSAQAFSRALLELLSDPQRLREMGSIGRAYVVRFRDYTHIAERVADTYRRLLAPGSSERATPVAR